MKMREFMGRELKSSITSELYMRMQPKDTGEPMRCSSSVPWMPMYLS